MKTGIWIVIAIAFWLLGFLGGYQISAHTGTEPGYFEAVEAAGYGGGGEKIEGISDEMQQYYEDLLEEE
jgi:hypothetical protein